jgi:hypothetical protein
MLVLGGRLLCHSNLFLDSLLGFDATAAET